MSKDKICHLIRPFAALVHDLGPLLCFVAILMSGTLMDNYIDDSGKKRINPVVTKDGKRTVVTPAVQKVREYFWSLILQLDKSRLCWKLPAQLQFYVSK